MEINEVFELLEENKNTKGIQNWVKLTKTTLDSYGIGLSILRKLAKKVGKNAALAKELWETNNYDAKVISLLIDDPKTITRDQIEKQVEQLEGGLLAHVFSSCGAIIGKTSFVVDVIDDWIMNGDLIRVSCGYGLLYDLSKSKKKNAPSDEYFLGYLKHINKKYKKSDKNTLLAMGGAILGIGKRNAFLNKHALELARKIGPIDFNEEGQHCDPFDVVKNLTSDYLINKFKS